MEGIKKTIKVQTKTMLVKKVPAKAATMVADDYESGRMDTGEKSVKFSSTDEILEIESRRVMARSATRNRLSKVLNVRARLGLNKVSDEDTATAAALHGTKKIIKLKQSPKRSNGQALKVSPLRSDEMEKPIKSRLSLKKVLSAPEMGKIVNRIGRASIGSRLGTTKAADGTRKASKKPSSSSSVFDRLGFNKK